MELVDVFCGGGLFSFAARAAGMTVTYGVDHDSTVLATYKANMPEARVVCGSVGPGSYETWQDAPVQLPEPAANLHIHLSPPCTLISHANTKSGGDKQSGIDALEWSIEESGRGAHGGSDPFVRVSCFVVACIMQRFMPQLAQVQRLSLRALGVQS